MTDFSSAKSVSASGMQAQAQRLRHLSENISNADTPGYRRKLISFQTALGQGEQISPVQVGRVRLDQSDLSTIYDPSHPLADEAGEYEGSNVNLLIELADAREAQRSYEANLKMFDQARNMSSSLMQLLRR
ncbi:flagellar basal body rod protein FlgC [Sulfitobacter sp. S223]|uniref:flagellar basal body rod protein FlgC n=1 Tax=Sulfitobacter sp. S223 TaxID=2867023 RepID=UPI0021A2B7AE|nr:flagellar basal body rod protein FlgC [Sulfitobacter sp. S223]UWR26294.1 flagellar basal body rod protein FlgC [Sulfitobacter sp. S223]